MKTSRAWLVWIIGSGLFGCNIETHTGDEQPSADAGCGSEKDIAAPCQRDTDCASASYCDGDQKHCVASASCTIATDCDASMTCDSARSTCVPTRTPTCSDVTSETDCVVRPDCAPLYAGVDCSCGPDCACQGGEPGCVCESFEFFRCEPAAP
jgi:hypothetical protein